MIVVDINFIVTLRATVAGPFEDAAAGNLGRSVARDLGCHWIGGSTPSEAGPGEAVVSLAVSWPGHPTRLLERAAELCEQQLAERFAQWASLEIETLAESQRRADQRIAADDVFGVDEVAQQLGVSQQRVYTLLRGAQRSRPTPGEIRAVVAERRRMEADPTVFPLPFRDRPLLWHADRIRTYAVARNKRPGPAQRK